MSARPFSEAEVVARIQERAGFRYQSAQLAAYFNVPTARMTEVLMLVVAKELVRRVRSPGSPTMYYLPSVQELEAEARQAAKQYKEVPEWSGMVRGGRVTSF